MDHDTFVPGLTLAEAFFDELVHPLLAQRVPELRFSAALIGPGSEVLGFDTPMSTDHEWGPRVMLFLPPEDQEQHAAAIRAYLADHLPGSYRGYSTHFALPDPTDAGVQRRGPRGEGPINHRVELFTIGGFFRSYMGLDPEHPMTAADWLALPTQKLRSIVTGGVFHDALGLAAVRTRFAWYPRDVWLYMLGCLWVRIGQEEHLMGRAGSVGDEIGSALIGARLVRDLMRIAFLLERQYPPYPKWFGTAFGQLACAPRLLPDLAAALRAGHWQDREAALARSYETLIDVQRALQIGGAAPRRTTRFHGRPFRVMHAGQVADAIFAGISDHDLRALAKARPIGSIDVISDNTDVLEDTALGSAIKGLYRGPYA